MIKAMVSKFIVSQANFSYFRGWQAFFIFIFNEISREISMKPQTGMQKCCHVATAAVVVCSMNNTDKCYSYCN